MDFPFSGVPSSQFHFHLWEEDLIYKFPSLPPLPSYFRLCLRSKLALEGTRGSLRLPRIMVFLASLAGGRATPSSFFPQGFHFPAGRKYLTLGLLSPLPFLSLGQLRFSLLPLVSRRDLFHRSLLPDASHWVFTFRDLGELAPKGLPYDFFGWTQPIQLQLQLTGPAPLDSFLSSLGIFFTKKNH